MHTQTLHMRYVRRCTAHTNTLHRICEELHFIPCYCNAHPGSVLDICQTLHPTLRHCNSYTLHKVMPKFIQVSGFTRIVQRCVDKARFIVNSIEGEQIRYLLITIWILFFGWFYTVKIIFCFYLNLNLNLYSSSNLNLNVKFKFKFGQNS